MANYAKSIPRDLGGAPMVESPAPYKTLATFSSENGTTSSVVTLHDSTTTLEVAAVATPAFIRWIARTDTGASVISAAGTANFDHTIPAGTVRTFVIPQERSNIQSVVGANIKNGLYNRVAWKTAGAGSILATQF